jgi:hypothetical protein
MLIDVTEILTGLIARNRGPDPLNPGTARKPDYGIEASLERNVLSVELTFRRGAAYCCMEYGCHLALNNGRFWKEMRAGLASQGINISTRLDLRLSCVIEDGALFFNLARPDPIRLNWYSFEPAAAYHYDISARETLGNDSARLFPFPADPTAWSIPEEKHSEFLHARQQYGAEHPNQPASPQTGQMAEDVVKPIAKALHGMLARARPFDSGWQGKTVAMFRGIDRYLWSVVVAERIDALVPNFRWDDECRRSRFMRAFGGFVEMLLEIAAASQPDKCAVQAEELLYLCACLMMTALGHDVLPRISDSPQYLSSAKSLGLVVAGNRIAFDESANGVLAQIAKTGIELNRSVTWMFELYYEFPPDDDLDSRLTTQIVSLGGRLDFREETDIPGVVQRVCLTFEFDDESRAVHAEDVLRQQGYHTEGVCQNGH